MFQVEASIKMRETSFLALFNSSSTVIGSVGIGTSVRFTCETNKSDLAAPIVALKLVIFLSHQLGICTNVIPSSFAFFTLSIFDKSPYLLFIIYYYLFIYYYLLLLLFINYYFYLFLLFIIIYLLLINRIKLYNYE